MIQLLVQMLVVLLVLGLILLGIRKAPIDAGMKTFGEYAVYIVAIIYLISIILRVAGVKLP